MLTETAPTLDTTLEPSPLANLPTLRKILVALDSHGHYSSQQTEAILLRSISLAQQHGSTLMILGCLPDAIPAPTETASGLIGLGMYGLDTRTAVSIANQHLHSALTEQENWLRSQCELATRYGVTTEWDSRQGEPGSQICNLATTWGADLIVVGRRGRQGLTEMLLGSVSNYVIHHAHCSVMVVQ
jgi:nucleotide-binding universal stress UspA family protein